MMSWDLAATLCYVRGKVVGVLPGFPGLLGAGHQEGTKTT